MSNYVIVPLSVKHAPHLAALDSECFSEPWSEKMFSELVQNPLAVYYVALCGDEVIGYGGIYKVLDEGELMNIAVSPKYRCRGVASMLLKRLIECSKECEIKQIRLEVRESNVQGRALYEKFGFTVDGKRKNYYSFPKEDAVLMSLAL